MNNTSNTESKFGTWYWNKSINKSGFDMEEEKYFDVNEKDESRTKKSKT